MMSVEDWKGIRVAVSGATGFLGYHLCRELTRRGAQVTGLVRAFSDVSRLVPLGVRSVIAPLDEPRLLQDACEQCDYVVHLAGAVDFNNDWQLCRRVNVQGTANILQAARETGVRRFIHASSIVAIGASKRPIRQDERSRWTLAGRKVPYVTTKRQAEDLALAERGRMEVVVVNPGSVIGPEDYTGSEFGVMCQRFWKGRIPFVFGGGSNFVDVRDVADGVLRAARQGLPGERYILGGANLSYTSFFSELARVAPRPIYRFRVPTFFARLGAQAGSLLSKRQRKRPLLSTAQARLLGLFFYYDCGKAQRDLGYRTRPFEETVRDTYAFWMSGRRSEA